MNPEDLYAHFYLGNIFKNVGDVTSARYEFEKVLEISPDYSWAYYNLAAIDFESGDIAAAVENLRQTVAYNPKDVEAYKVWARILFNEKAFGEVINVLSQAIRKCGENGDLYYLLGEAYVNSGDNTNALDAFSSALKNYNTLTFDVNSVKEKLNRLH